VGRRVAGWLELGDKTEKLLIREGTIDRPTSGVDGLQMSDRPFSDAQLTLQNLRRRCFLRQFWG
jgi:hypothetical protein